MLRAALTLVAFAGFVPLVAFAGAPTLITVDSTIDAVDVLPDDGLCDADAGAEVQCTLRAAVQTANAIGGEYQIFLGTGTYALTLKRVAVNDAGTGDLDITTDIEIEGNGSALTIIDGKKGKDRIFDIGPTGQLSLRDLTLRNGKTAKGDFNATQPSEIGGGCIRSAGSLLDLEGVTVTRCKSIGDAGCIQIETGEFDARDTSLSACKAKLDGGGIEIDTNATLALLLRVTISGCKAGGEGGGIETSGAELLLGNVTLSGNKAKFGGGLEVEDASDVTINNSTLAANKAKTGAAIDVATGENVATISNSILQSKKRNDCAGDVTSDGGNLESGTSCGFDAEGDLQSADPLLAKLADNGGEVLTQALGAGSPALGRGNVLTCEPEDARFVSRAVSCDSGAYELALE